MIDAQALVADGEFSKVPTSLGRNTTTVRLDPDSLRSFHTWRLRTLLDQCSSHLPSCMTIISYMTPSFPKDRPRSSNECI